MTAKAISLSLLLCAIGPVVAGGASDHAVLWSNGSRIDLGTLGGDLSRAYGINDSGQVVGWSTTGVARNAFRWSNGKMKNLGYLNVNYSEAYGINEAGRVVGYSLYYTLAITTRAFLWRGGMMDGLPGTNTGAHAINNRGQIVGGADYTAFLLGKTGYRAVLWSGERRTELGTLGGESSLAYDLNDVGQVAGASEIADGSLHAFRWKSGSMRDLGTLGGDMSAAYGINRRGAVVGKSRTAEGSIHAFLWRNGSMIDLGTLGGKTSVAYGINDEGSVVGESRKANGSLHAFLWRNGSMTDLGKGSAVAINNHGQVAGYSSARLPGSSRIEPADWRTVSPLRACTTEACQRALAMFVENLKVTAAAAIDTATTAERALAEASGVDGLDERAKAEARAAEKGAEVRKATTQFVQAVVGVQNLHD